MMQPTISRRPEIHVAPSKKPHLIITSFFLLAMITICNLNGVANQTLDISQLFSPIILILCVIGWLGGGGKVGTFTKTAVFPFFVALSFYLAFGLAVGISDSRLDLFRSTYKIGCSLVVLPAVAIMALLLSRSGRENTVLKVLFIATFCATSSIFIPVVYPPWHQMMSSVDTTRASGFFSNPNEAGEIIMYLLAVVFALAAKHRQWAWIAIGVPLAFCAVFFTFSRSSFLGIVILTFTLSLLVFPPRRVLLMGLAVGFGLAIILAARTYIDRSAEENGKYQPGQARRLRLLNEFLEGRVDHETTSGRSDLIKWTVKQWEKSPIVGHGLSSFSGAGDQPGAHNTVLMVLGETGVVGLLPFVIAWLMMLRSAMHAQERWLLVLALGVLLAFSLSCMVSHTVFDRRYGIFILAAAFSMIHSSTPRQRVRVRRRISSY